MSVLQGSDLPLGRFIYDRSWVPVRGSYIYPMKYFGLQRSTNPNDYIEVIRVIEVGGRKVAVTRGGGVFVRDHGEFGTEEGIGALVAALNLLLCELALHGMPSEPMTFVDIQCGKLIGQHAVIVGGSGDTHKGGGLFFLLCAAAQDVAQGYG